MTPDLDLLAQALDGEPTSWDPVNTGGYTRSRAWHVQTADGPVFVKEAEDAGSLHMLRREAVVYRGVRDSFLPAFVGFADSGERALLAIEYLTDAIWPPPYPDDVAPLFDALRLVAASEPPAEVPAQRPRRPRWEEVSSDPEPLLELGLCSREWLTRSLDTLVEAESKADFTGSALVHNDIYSGNVAFSERRALFVDWGAAVRGSPWIDVAFALLSLRVEGATRPRTSSSPAKPRSPRR